MLLSRKESHVQDGITLMGTCIYIHVHCNLNFQTQQFYFSVLCFLSNWIHHAGFSIAIATAKLWNATPIRGHHDHSMITQMNLINNYSEITTNIPLNSHAPRVSLTFLPPISCLHL